MGGTPAAISLANLRPARPGEVRNPAGRNGYSTNRLAKDELHRLLTQAAEHGVSRLTAILERLITSAEAGKPWAIAMLLDRLVPKIEHHEHSIAAAAPERLADALALAAERIRAGAGGGDARRALEAGSS